MAQIVFGNKLDTEIRIQRWRNAVHGNIDQLCSQDVKDSIQVHQKLMDYGHQMAISVALNILTQNIETVIWPRDWVQAFKERWFPGWAKKIFPVKYKGVDIKAIYPKATLPHPLFKASPIYRVQE